MNLLAKRRSICLEKRIHILPAIELPDAANLRLDDRLRRVASPVAKDEALDMRRLDLAAVIEDIARRGDQHLRDVQTRQIDLRVAQGDEDLVASGGLADATHFVRIGGEAVLAVFLQQGETLLVVDLPSPVDVARDP